MTIINLLVTKGEEDIFTIQSEDGSYVGKVHPVDLYQYDLPEANVALLFHQINDPIEDLDIEEDNIWEVVAHPYNVPYCSGSSLLRGIPIYSDI